MPVIGDLTLTPNKYMMQHRAGLLFLAKTTGRILLILEQERWTVPTFARTANLLADVEELLNAYARGKIVPIELYISKDRGFEYGTYVCVADQEFLTRASQTMAWCDLDHLPKNLHSGLKFTLTNQIIRTKILTIMEMTIAVE